MTQRDSKVSANIPIVGSKTVLLIKDPASPIDIPDSYYWEAVRVHLGRYGYRFIALPDLLSEIHPIVADYLFPGYSMPGAMGIYRRIQDLAGIRNGAGFLYKKDGSTYFKSILPGELNDAVQELLDALQESSRRRVRDPRSVTGMFGVELLPRMLEPMDYSAHCERPNPSIVIDGSRKLTIEEDLDPQTLRILADVQRLMDEYHLTIDELKVIIGYTVKLSRMKITRTGRIFLSDFPNAHTKLPKEIKMDHLTKMVYFFYLKHPEGVRVKEIDSHIDELMHLYMGITGRDDKDAIRASILNHVGAYSNSINVSMSRIRTAFKNAVDESIARFYWIEGNSGEPYSIAIDRDYVIWEYGD